MKTLIALLFLGVVAVAWAKSAGSSSAHSIFKRGRDKRGECNALGDKCSWTAWDRCCNELQCHKVHLTKKGTCQICKFLDSYCSKDSQCCPGLQCNWRGKCVRDD